MGCNHSHADPVMNEIKQDSGCEYTEYEEEEEEDLAVRYFSFQEFVQTVERPTLYEYLFTEQIGSGSMSRVYHAVNEETEEEFAVKVYNNTQLKKHTLGEEETRYESVKREIELMSEMNHRYLLSILEVIEDPKTNSTLMVMPFAAHGTLQSCLDENKIDSKGLVICFYQIAEGLRHLHTLNIVHRDIKPDNILCFNETYFVLSDFSVSSKISSPDEKLEDTMGSPAFLSPEECSGELCAPKPCDVWGYGVAFYLSVFRKFPFNLEAGHGKPMATTMIIVTEMLETQELDFPVPVPDGMDPGVVDFLKWVLNKDPETRPTFEDIVKHEFFKEAWPIDEELKRRDEELRNEEEEEEQQE